jgi:hypothetical protein
VLLLLGSLGAWASDAETAAKRRAAAPRTFSLLEQCRDVPAEFGAHCILHLLEAEAIPGKEWRLDTATEALQLANSARHAAPRRLAPGLRGYDSRGSLWHAAYSQGLDRLTLSLRAIEHLRRVDPAKAVEAFARIPRPAVAASTCADPLVDDFSAWYAAAGRLGAKPLPILQTIQSHVEIAPAIGLILETASDSESLEALAAALATRLGKLPADDRTFNAALFHAPRGLQQLRQILTSRELSTAPLDEGWLRWMRNGLAAPACAETREPGGPADARDEAFALFNRIFPPLEPELRKPSGDSVAADMGPFAENDATRRQSALLRQLLFGGRGTALSDADKNTPEWRQSLDEFMQSIEGRTQSGDESAIEFFYRQSQLWAGVLMVAPAGAAREKALTQYIGFLLADAPHIDPAILFSQVASLVESTRSLHGAGFSRTLEALEQSGHPVLRLYAQLEAAYPTRPGQRQQ